MRLNNFTQGHDACKKDLKLGSPALNYCAMLHLKHCTSKGGLFSSQMQGLNEGTERRKLSKDQNYQSIPFLGVP